MSRAKLFNMVKSRGENKTGRNAFDLSNRHVYSQKASKITPIKVFHTYPDDYLEVNLSEFTQNKVPLNTAAFLSGKKEHLAYFVPYNTIWHNFNQYQATREDPESTLLYDKGISYEPRLALWDLYNSAMYFATMHWFFSSGLAIPALRLAHQHLIHDLHMSFNSPSEFVSYLKSNYAVSASDPQRSITYWDSYINDALEIYKEESFIDHSYIIESNYTSFDCYENNVLTQSIPLYKVFTNMFGEHTWCDWIQKLDMLGYGNIYPIIHDFLVDMDAWLEKYVLNSTDFVLDENNFRVTMPYKTGGIDDYSILHLTDNSYVMLDYIHEFPVGSPYAANYAEKLPFAPIIWRTVRKLQTASCRFVNQVPVDEYVNPYALYAYNKCFYDYMRNVYYDTDYSVYNYNCDFVDGKTLEGSIIDRGYIPIRFYHIEPHQWKKDMFTGVLPDNQLGQVSEIVFSNTIPAETVNVVSDTNNLYQDSRGYTLSDPSNAEFNSSGNLIYLDGTNEDNALHTHNLSVPVSGHTLTNSLNVLALKRAEAIQEYRQDLMRAGNRTQDIFKQVYGTSPKSELDEMPYFIEVSANDLNINPIISTAQIGDGVNQSLGDIAARCTIGGSELHFKFSTKDFGVILFLSYIVPDSFYNSYRLDPCVTHLDQEAHGLPYFQNLGLQPVIGSYLNNLKGSVIRNRTLGFAPPYIERKTDIDLVHGDFCDAYIPDPTDNVDDEYQGEMSHWVVARTDMQQEDTVSLRNFYIDPRILDNVFTFNSDSDYSTDQFFSYCTIKINAVRAFSELGLPRF